MLDMNSSDDIRQRLRSVLLCLIQYKKIFIQKYTLSTQDPNALNTVKTVMRRQCGILIEFMKTRNLPNNPDADLSQCLDCLKVALEPWDMDLSVLCPNFCEMIFINSEFNLSENIIDDILENYCPTLDEPQVENTQT